MTKKRDYEEGFFDNFIGHLVHVECKSWNHDFALKTWGPNYHKKTAIGEIRQVRQKRDTGHPKFNIYFKDTDEVYTNYDLDYVLKYSLDVSLQYHHLKAEYIVRKAREATAEVQRGQAESEEEEFLNDSRKREEERNAEELNPPKKAAKKRGGNAPVLAGREKKKQRAAPDRGANPLAKTTDNAEDQDLNIDLSENDDGDLDEESDNESDEEGGYGDNTPEQELEADDSDFLQWQYQTPPVQPANPFRGASGPTHGLSAEVATPIDYFNLFISTYFWTRFAQYTNAKARSTEVEQDGHVRAWYNTCGAEMKAWVASVIYFCVCKTLTFEQFYNCTVDPSRCKKWFPSWRRWTSIKRFFKVSDPEKDPHNKQDREYKVRELFDHFISACRANYWPDMSIALDEAVKKFKGRCSFKQYIKNKPVKWGIKIFCVCCSLTSYLWNAYFYVGKSRSADDEHEDVSVTHQTVIKLLTPLKGKNHHVYMDNYYTGIPLFKELQSMDIYATGTVRTNRKGLDPKVTMRKQEETFLKKKPGTTRFSSCGQLVYAAWFDKRPVHMLSNCHLPVGDDTVEHWFTARRGEVATTASGKILKQISICPIVKWYRKWMGAVDRFDQYRAYIRLEMRTAKFWHVMFWFIVESALVNSWILYKSTMKLAGLELAYTHLEFRLAIVLALAAEWEDMGCVFNPDNLANASPRSLLKIRPAKKVRASFGERENARYSSNDMHFSMLADIPKLEGQKTKNRQLRCINPGCEKAKTTKWCSACFAPLCFPKCYMEYHTQEKAN
jgi:hypothetical protein